jgi:ribonuclease HI
MSDINTSESLVAVHQWKLFVDGASRNNPGPSGAGFYIEKDGTLVEQGGYYLGVKTNNQAEYLALLLGLHFLEPHITEGDRIAIIADSELLVRQIYGVYRVKDKILQQLHAAAVVEIRRLKANIFHMLRHANKNADAMANQGIDTKKTLPPQFLEKMQRYEIVF